MQSPRSSLSILSAIVIVVFSILMLLIIGTLVSTFLLRTDSGVDISRSPVFFLEILLVVPAAIMLHKQDCPLKKGFRLNRVNSQLIGASVIVGLSGAVLADELDRLTQLIFPVPKFFDEALKEGFRYSNTVDFFLLKKCYSVVFYREFWNSICVLAGQSLVQQYCLLFFISFPGGFCKSLF